MIKACISFLKRSYVTRFVCMLLLVLCMTSLTGCGGDTEPNEDGSAATTYEQSVKGCWVCSLFDTVYNAVTATSNSIVPSVASSAVGLIAVGYGLWLAVFILKYVGAFHEQDAGSFWTTLGGQTFWLIMGVALLRSLAGGGLGSALTSFAEPVFGGFVNAGLTVVQASGGEVPCGPGGDPRSGLICLIDALQEKLAFGGGLGGLAASIGATLFSKFTGFIIWLLTAYLKVYLPILLLDCVFRYGIALCMLPLAVASYTFKQTRNFTGVVAKMFMEIGMAVIGMCVFAACCVEILKQYIDRFMPYAKDPSSLMSDPGKLDEVIYSPGLTGLIFLCFFFICFADVILDFTGHLAGGASGSMGKVLKDKIKGRVQSKVNIQKATSAVDGKTDAMMAKNDKKIADAKEKKANEGDKDKDKDKDKNKDQNKDQNKNQNQNQNQGQNQGQNGSANGGNSGGADAGAQSGGGDASGGGGSASSGGGGG